MEIKEVTNKIEKAFNGNGLIVFGGVFIFLFIIAYITQSKKESEGTPIAITGAYASYPDSVTNANVIIDTLQESIDNATGEMVGHLGDVQQEIIDNIDDGVSEIIEKIPEEPTTTTDSVALESVYSKLNTLESNSNKSVSGINTLIESVSNFNQTVTSNSGSVKSSSISDYFAKTPYTGVSIVDGLKAIGEYNASSYSSRARIAKANGIKNYKGTASQNTQLLNLLKQGKLKRG